MPEGPEVAISAIELNKEIKGLYITEVDVRERAKGKRLDEFPTGVEIESVTNKGKHIIFTLRRPGRKRRIYLLSRLGMEGHWGYDPNIKHVEMVLTLSKRKKKKGEYTYTEAKKLVYDASRPFGGNDVCLTQEHYDDHFKRVGICMINEPENITSEWWKEKVRNPRLSKDKNIAQFLMEQHNFAGIGNYLKSEILFAAKIHPGRKLRDLTDDEIELLRVKSLEKILHPFNSGGLTISSFYTPSGKEGKFKKKIYGKKDGETIKYKGVRYRVHTDIFDSNRTSYFVPELQK